MAGGQEVEALAQELVSSETPAEKPAATVVAPAPVTQRQNGFVLMTGEGQHLAAKTVRDILRILFDLPRRERPWLVMSAFAAGPFLTFASLVYIARYSKNRSQQIKYLLKLALIHGIHAVALYSLNVYLRRNENLTLEKKNEEWKHGGGWIRQEALPEFLWNKIQRCERAAQGVVVLAAALEQLLCDAAEILRDTHKHIVIAGAASERFQTYIKQLTLGWASAKIQDQEHKVIACVQRGDASARGTSEHHEPDNLRTDSSTANAEKMRLRDELAKSRTELANAEAKSLRAELAAAKAEAATLRESLVVETLRAELTTTRADLTKLQQSADSSHAAVASEVDRLQKELALAKSSAESAADIAASEAESLRAELAAAKAEAATMRESLVETMSNAASEVKTLRAELTTAKTDLTTLQESVGSKSTPSSMRRRLVDVVIPFSENWQTKLAEHVAILQQRASNPEVLSIADCKGRDLGFVWNHQNRLELFDVPALDLFPLVISSQE